MQAYDIFFVQSNAAHLEDFEQHTSASLRENLAISEDEQIKMAKRITIIQHLPLGKYTARCEEAAHDNVDNECVICMCEFLDGDDIRYLPCMHIYHMKCIDDWLLRYLKCPSCLEPVDSALFSSFDVRAPVSISRANQNKSDPSMAKSAPIKQQKPDLSKTTIRNSREEIARTSAETIKAE